MSRWGVALVVLMVRVPKRPYATIGYLLFESLCPSIYSTGSHISEQVTAGGIRLSQMDYGAT